MKKNLLTLLLLSFIALSSAFAQSRTITGKVTSADDGLPLPGVSVKIQGTTISTQTNPQGDYSINVPSAGQSLVFTFIGYANQTVTIGSRSVVAVKLVSDNRSLSEVVIQSYGTVQTKREVGGAVSTIGAKEFENQPIASLQTALQGRAAGVVVTSQNGIPGGAINVRIRGVGSFSGSSQPLYVVDGVQLSGETFSGFTQGNTLAGINPDDIESIDILKDAASTSLYGSSGANGVVLITTKKGKKGKTTLNFNYFTGRSSTIKTFNTLTSPEYIQLQCRRQ